MERLAAIAAKSAQIAGASFWVDTYVSSLLFPESKQAQIIDAAVRAHQTGTEFAKLNGSRELADFLQDALSPGNNLPTGKKKA
ncbi:hypothetical protein SDC9_200561 [bioreactor metagenome]|uniref:Uncharacterized protein n=1 Tax=bioreactor metagenome TaxID=1076179 RepID=A0A645INJ5_9ZZZZ